MKAKKIGIIAPEFPPDTGGVQSYSYNLCKELALRKDYEISVFIPKDSKHSDSGLGHVSSIKALQFRQRYDINLLKEFEVDLWHCLNASYSWMALHHPNVFISVHGNDFLKPYHLTARLDFQDRFNLPFGSRLDFQLGKFLTKKLILKSLPKARAVFVNSHYTQKRLTEICSLCDANSLVAGVGVTDFYFELPLNNSSSVREQNFFKFITVSRLSEERKNIDIVLKALQKLKATTNFHYTIVGEGDLRGKLEKLATELGLNENVSFTGKVSQEEIREKLQDSDLFILTSSSSEESIEGFGIVYLEASACGIPVLAAPEGGALEAVQPLVNGFFVDKIDPQNIFVALSKFCNGHLSFNRQACRDFAAQYKWSRIIDYFIGEYQKC
jgi:phosphatidyl-myo-inositol dimannoside synthase